MIGILNLSRGFQVGVERPKPKRLLRPITTDENNIRTNQNSKQKHVTGVYKARENICEQVTICFSFTSDWLRKWRGLL